MVDVLNSKRRWFQFRLRTLLIFVLICLIPYCWFLVRVHRQREAVAAIEKGGGSVEYGELHGPAWLRKLLGDKYFAYVVSASLAPQTTDADLEHLDGLTEVRGLLLTNTNITDAGLEHLKGLTQLQQLVLTDTKITDAGLKHLKGFSQLDILCLDGTKITDAGLEHLKGLTQLQALRLDRTKLTDAGLEHLKGLTRLGLLSLDGTIITGSGLEHLKGMTRLNLLFLSDTKITGGGLEHLKGLAQLRGLYLRNTKITDAGVEYLKGLGQIQDLSLDNIKITDAGLEHLKGLKNLQVLHMAGTQVSDAGMKKLQLALLTCHIDHRYRAPPVPATQRDPAAEFKALAARFVPALNAVYRESPGELGGADKVWLNEAAVSYHVTKHDSRGFCPFEGVILTTGGAHFSGVGNTAGEFVLQFAYEERRWVPFSGSYGTDRHTPYGRHVYPVVGAPKWCSFDTVQLDSMDHAVRRLVEQRDDESKRGERSSGTEQSPSGQRREKDDGNEPGAGESVH